jgi:hypothetical protein
VTDRWANRQSWLAIALTAVAIAGWMIVAVVIGTAPGEAVMRVAAVGVGEGVAFLTAWTLFPIMGSIIIHRRPGNAIGWLCVLGGLHNAAFALLTAFATSRLIVEPGSSVAIASAWLSHTLIVTLSVFPVLILLRFPTGRLLGPGWRRAELAAMLGIVAIVVLAAVEPMQLVGFPTTRNPFGLGGARLTVLDSALFPIFWSLPLGTAVAALVVRYRRGSVIERLQLRWLGAASVLLVFAAMSTPFLSPEMGVGRISTLSAVAYAVGFSSIPVAIGIAIVRHRLYDIDHLVKRTLVYAIVSATLVIVYGGAVLALSTPLTTILPSAGNTLTTAVSTLLVAALFRPVRNRAQVAVDRRFDRERREATTMVDSFSGRIRGEVELDGIVGDLLGAARAVVHPASSTCWLRGGGAGDRALLGSPGGR